MEPTALFKCLADETRLTCILLIAHHEQLCVCQLTDSLRVSQPKISRHLAELRKCGVVVDTRQGKWVYYSLNPKLPEWVSTIIESVAKAQMSRTPSYLPPINSVQGCD